MVALTGIYEGNLRCKIKHGPSETEYITDAPVDNHGKGESFSPTDLLAASLPACMMTIMGIQAKTMKIDLRGMHFKASKEMSKDIPRRIAKIILEFWIPGKYDDKQKKQLIQAAEACPVHQSLSESVKQDITYHWES